ncbi:MAG TPA: hypothetical protein VGS27_01905 [Candidatus Sulfotelmatobacter sp.]|nr:hypothetical protein [Candidatus Sulfotelmatobacter sp.]
MDPKFQAILSALPAKEPPSRLEPYRTLILEMRKRGRSYREIAQVLKKSCDLSVGTSTVNDFVLARTKSSVKRSAPAAREVLVIKKDKKELIGHISTYKDSKDVKDTVSTSKSLEGTTRTIKAVKDQPPKTHKKKVLFEYNPDEPLRLQRNQKSKE